MRCSSARVWARVGSLPQAEAPRYGATAAWASAIASARPSEDRRELPLPLSLDRCCDDTVKF
jgi:hypothetical protein